MQTKRLQGSFEDSYSSLAYSSWEFSGLIASYTSRQWETHAFSDFGGKMGLLGHNFGSRHARRSSKSSIDARDHLVSKQSLSQNFGQLDWRPGPVKVGQKKTKTPPLCEPLPGEPLTQIKKIFFDRTKKTCRIRRGFEQLSGYSGWQVIIKKVRAHLLAFYAGRKLVRPARRCRVIYSIFSMPVFSANNFCNCLEMKFASPSAGIPQAGAPETAAKSVTPCFTFGY